MSDYLTDFVQESEERITELNNALLTFEREPDDEEAMENIFRIAHTLKGNCGALGLETASDLAHAIEDLLDAVRRDDLEVTAELMDVVFDAVDELETMIDEVAETGEIETDPSATIEALRNHLADADGAVSGIEPPTADEIDDVCSRFEPPADDGHDVYLARLAIAQEEGINNGELVVDALIDAFDLIGTDPPRQTIEAADYGESFDAVFGTAVGENAIASGLEPVEEVDEFEIVDVSDRFEGTNAVAGATTAQSADDTEPGDDISADEAQDLEVDDLLDEFNEFDNLDEMVEDVEDEELDAFEDMGEAGSFDDLLDEEDIDEIDAEPGDSPADGLDADDGSTAKAAETTESAADDETGADAASESEDEEVDDAGAVFDELKDEVEMVGFDELQDELEELEFDEFDEEEEVDMDELLGNDADDDSFLDDEEPSADAVDDILVESESNDVPSPDDTAEDRTVTADESSADVGDNDAFSPTEDDLDDAVDDLEFDEEDSEAATDIDDAGSRDDTLEASFPDTPADDSVAADSEPDAPSDGTADVTDLEAETVDEDIADDSVVAEAESDEMVAHETGTDETVTDEDVAAEAVVDEDVAAEATVDEDATDETATAADVSDETVAADESPDIGEATEDVASESDADDIEDDTADETETADGASVADDGDYVVADTADSDSFDDATEPTTDATVESVDTSVTTDIEADAAAEETDETAVVEETADAAETAADDGATTDSFDDSDDDGFEPTAAFDDDFETADDESDPFDDDSFAADTDDSFADFSDDPADSETESEDDFESGFDEQLDEQPDDESFAGTTEFDTDTAGFESPASDAETDSDSSLPAAASFGDDGSDSDTDGDDDDDVVRIVDEPEMEIPDIPLPEASDQPDADDETDEIQSVRVDIEQVDSLLTLVEGLVTSRVRLRHAADADDDGTALETELDALSDLTTDLQETVMDIRLVPLQTVTNRLPRVVRDIARDQDKEVAFEMSGENVELDRSILDRIGDPLIHLVRNAVDHGIESPERREEVDKPSEGSVEVNADRSRDRVTITVEDDGSGLDPDRLRDEAVEAGVLDSDEAADLPDEEAYDLIFHPGLSTAEEVTDVSGRGVGMDVVKRTIEDLEGTVSIDSDEGEGTTVTMTLPVTVAIDEILFVESGGKEFGIPTKAVQDIEPAAAVETTAGESVLRDDDNDYPVIQLTDVLETPTPGANGDGMVVRIRDEVREVALHCDHVQGQQEVVVKPFEGVMSDIPGLSGATVRGRGEVVNILDVTTL
ncbi:chemotaxis protein CheA [Natrinema sp. SYSU A 869]|uniref:chemotaxis protein CheA n=1 Tax=Natrinema sp. SYSU A 869 TaxID=2871694 RepID=UPI001CA42CDE|nr:chemotaxis protein CheA [Natrinema sp. SYSU A 869]